MSLESFEGTEVNDAEPTTQHDRSALGTLTKLAGQPIDQAQKLCKYAASAKAKVEKLTKVCSAQALEFAKLNRPDLF